MADTISVSIIITFAAELLFSLALPILALVIWKKKEGTELRPAWIGAAAYFVFGMVLEQLINAAVLGTGSSAVSAFLLGHPWLYAVYGGLSAGILEETARFLVYRTMLKDSVGRENAVTFGVGFGGLECIMVLGLTVLSTLMMSISFNNMGAEAFAAQYANSEYQIVLETIAEINAISPLAGVMNCVERTAVFALQIERFDVRRGAFAEILAVPRQHPAARGCWLPRSAVSDERAYLRLSFGGAARCVRRGGLLPRTQGLR